MSRKIVIDSCGVCPDRKHSGAFTRGGAWPVCHGPGVVDWNTLNVNYNDPEAGKKWSPPILPVDENRNPTGEFPDWCPLEKNGAD